MIANTLLAATLAATQPQAAPAAPAPAMDHGKMAPDTKPAAKMDCCKDGCTCCAKAKDKPAT